MGRAWVLALVLLAVACGSGPTVTRLDSQAAGDLSGRWNDTDSRLVARAMIAQMLQGDWLDEFAQAHPERPRPVIVGGTVANRTLGYIDVGTFLAEIERAVTSSRQASFVAGRRERGEVRDERRDQALHASDETRKDEGRETGADFLLKGELRSTEDRAGGAILVAYQVTLALINVETNEKAWIGDHTIRKRVEQ
jgi:PBP1b-binding outer membrane lipoprotein LpoB